MTTLIILFILAILAMNIWIMYRTKEDWLYKENLLTSCPCFKICISSEPDEESSGRFRDEAVEIGENGNYTQTEIKK